MPEFVVYGPYPVPVQKHPQGRSVNRDKLDEFWQNSGLDLSIGCYVFGIRSGGGLVPVYIGRATKSFRQECFTHHKLTHYNEALLEYLKGTPVMFFLERQGRGSSSSIDDVEKFLIEVGVARNPCLSNIKGTKCAEWSIRGVLRNGAGVPSQSSQEFKKMMGL